MIEPRLYRVAFLPALLALVVVAFSLQNRPPALPQDSAADVLFDDEAATSSAARIARRYPDRRPGTPDDLAAAEDTAQQLQGFGFEVGIDRYTVDEQRLANVVATRTGSTRRRIVLLAPRDSIAVPDAAGSASDTATLIELGRALEGRSAHKTLVLVSVDGTTLDQEGVRRFITTAEDADQIEVIVTVSDLGAGPPALPALVGWSDDERAGNLSLEQTALASLSDELPRFPESPGTIDQIAHLALPVGPGAQGLLLDLGYDAVRVAGAGVLGFGNAPQQQPDPRRLGAFGRSLLQMVAALDSRPIPVQEQRTYLTVGRKVLPGWAVTMLAISLILPALVASIDAAARARRQGEAITAWLIWVGRSCAAFAVGLLFVLVIGLLGIGSAVAVNAPLPAAVPLDLGAAVIVTLTAAVVAGTWVALRPLAALGRGEAERPGTPAAGVALSLVTSVAAVVLWLINPFAALFAIAPVHFWMLATLGDAPMPGRSRVVLFLIGLAAPLALATYYLFALDLNPAAGAWYLLLLVIGGKVSFSSALVMCVFSGALVSALMVIFSQARSLHRGSPGPSTRGPGGIAGPGSLGAVSSSGSRPLG